MLTLTRTQLDLDAGTLRLEPGTTKNDEGREVDLTRELIVLLGAQVERVKALEEQLGRVIRTCSRICAGPGPSGRAYSAAGRSWGSRCVTSRVPGPPRAGCPASRVC